MPEQPLSLIIAKARFAEYPSEPVELCVKSGHRKDHATVDCDCVWCRWRRGFDEQYDVMMLEYRKYTHDKKSIERRHKRLEAKNDVFQRLGGRCAGCGLMPSDLAVIDFHEPDGRIVEGRIPSDFLTTPKKIEMLKEQLPRLVPLCSNCHRIFHFGQLDAANKVSKQITQWREHRDSHCT